MKFNTLRLTGFKSFVDPTELVLSAGLTGVVGPNGCGKSNLLEALRWVMGENRAKSMRGDGMEDVIFAGAETRPAKSFAEVALLLDNSDKQAPTQFNESETLEVSRRITRNAGSAFRVNGKEVRARDVRVLFADAATGSQSPSLVRQGQIGLLIAAKPQGRRKILEDAAGVSGLYERRREVETRLKAAEENLIRVDDVLSRLDSQIAGLRRQARQAERYGELTTAIKEAAAELVWLRYRVADAEALAAESAVQEATRAVATATTEESEAARVRNEAEDALPPLREEAAVAQAIHQRLIAKRDAIAAEEARARDTIERLERDAVRFADDLSREAELATDAGTAIEALEAERAEMRTSVIDPAALTAATAAVVQAEAAVTRAEANRDALAAKAAAGAAERDSAARLLKDAERALEEAQKRQTAHKARTADITTKLDAATEQLNTARENAQTAANADADAPERLAVAESHRAALEESESENRAAFATAKATHEALDSEFALLERSLAADERVSGGGVISRMRAAPGYELALAAALGDEASAGEESAFASTLRGWLALTVLSSPPGMGEPLTKHVGAPTALARRLGATSIVSQEDGPQAQTRLKPGQRLVSPEGDLWRWDGYFSGADLRGADPAALRLQRLNRRESLQREVSEAAAALTVAKQRRDDLATKLKDAREAEAAARSVVTRNKDTAATAARQLADAEADHARLAASSAQSLEDAARLEAAVTEAAARLAEAQTARERVGDPAALQQEAETSRQTLGTDRLALEAARATNARMRGEESRRTKRLVTIKSELDGWRKRATSADKRRMELSKRVKDAEAELGKAQSLPAKLAESRGGLDDEVRAAETRVGTSADALTTAETDLRAKVQTAIQAATALATAREGLARAEALSEGAAERKEAALATMREETNATPDELAERFADLRETAPDAVETRLLRARADRERLGAVNLRAKTEIEEATEERGSLGSEKEELEEAILKLRKGLAALNREGRERLLAAFTQVNAHFKGLFTHLFGGGEAELQLTESDDPLEAGLEIMCQPPGKRLQTLTLLSGGEQTLTAMALIFAVFLVNPAPVCVLDEVDAPLDDANVERFCDLLDEMTTRSDARFLIISHHALTMSRMNRLFGVTMVERGVSKLVSVDIGAAVKLVEAG